MIEVSKTLIIGDGFVGSAAAEQLRLTADVAGSGMEVHVASRRNSDPADPFSHQIDMLEPDSVRGVLTAVRPEVIIDTAAILGRRQDQERLPDNPVMAETLLRGLHETGLDARVIMLGSSAVYGVVDASALPIAESAPLRPADPYGLSKHDESVVTERLASQYGLDVVEARLFSLIGPGMPASNLLGSVIRQVKAIREDIRQEQAPVVTVRNLEAARDYVDVRDVVAAMQMLATVDRGKLEHRVYNVGSGQSTTNRMLIKAVLRHSGLAGVGMEASDTQPEPLVGSAHADISRLRALGWRPQYSIDETVAAVVDADTATH